MKTRHNILQPTLIYLCLFVIIAAVFAGVSRNGFVNWDDDANVYRNPYFNPVTVPHVLYFWQHPYLGTHRPLTYTTWAFIAHSTRLPQSQVDPSAGTSDFNPATFHTANLLLHVLNVILVFVILKFLVQQNWAAFVGALLFGLHPIQVEAVAWITGMNDVLCAFFSLAALWQYLIYTRHDSQNAAQRTILHYFSATILFILALLCKPAAVAIPFVAWTLDRWATQRSLRQSVISLTPWIFAAIICAFLSQTEAIEKTLMTPLWNRPLIAGDALVFYLVKLVLPLQLAPDYGRSPQWVIQQPWIYLSWMIPTGIISLLLWKRKQHPVMLLSAGIFILAVLPVLGLLPFRFQAFSTVADRYLYFAMLGPALGVAYIMALPRWRKNKVLIPSVCLVLFCLALLSTQQIKHWHSTTTLFEHTLKVNTRSWLAYNNLGSFQQSQGQIQKAIGNYEAALQINSNFAIAHYNLATLLVGQKEIQRAITHYQEAIRLRPDYAKAHFNLGTVYHEQRNYQMAMSQYKEALRWEPRSAQSHYNLATLFHDEGEIEQAINHYQKAISINPNYSAAHYNLSSAYAAQGNIPAAIMHCREALRLNPDMAIARQSLALLIKTQQSRSPVKNP